MSICETRSRPYFLTRKVRSKLPYPDPNPSLNLEWPVAVSTPILGEADHKGVSVVTVDASTVSVGSRLSVPLMVVGVSPRVCRAISTVPPITTSTGLRRPVGCRTPRLPSRIVRFQISTVGCQMGGRTPGLWVTFTGSPEDGSPMTTPVPSTKT